MRALYNRNHTLEMVMTACDNSNRLIIKSGTQAVHMVQFSLIVQASLNFD